MSKYKILYGAGHIQTGRDELDVFYRAGFVYELTDEQAAPLLAQRQAVREGEEAPGPAFTPLETLVVTDPEAAPVPDGGALLTGNEDEKSTDAEDEIVVEDDDTEADGK
jgi:hypothetical protein